MHGRQKYADFAAQSLTMQTSNEEVREAVKSHSFCLVFVEGFIFILNTIENPFNEDV